MISPSAFIVRAEARLNPALAAELAQLPRLLVIQRGQRITSTTREPAGGERKTDTVHGMQ